jgi:carbamoyl-phosphate synthase large subunit
VLVTGGAGVIAGELLAQLSRVGATVLSVDHLPLAAPPAGVEHLQGDLAKMDLEPLATFGPEHVLHLAATFERSHESPEFWAENWNDNVVASHRITELAERSGGIETFTFASSYLVYDPRQYLREAAPTAAFSLDEEARLLPRNLCGAAKLYAEAEIEFQRRVRGLGFRSVRARIYRVYGRGSRDVVSRWVRAALAGEPIDVYHSENRFDYVFAGDVAEGLLRLVAAPAAEGVVNLASGRARPVSDVIAAIEAATGRRITARSRDVDEPFEASQADVTRLRALTGWAPDTSLEDGVRLLVDFERGRAANPAAGRA